MSKQTVEIPIGEFRSGETDFGTRIARSPAAAKVLQDEIITPMFEAAQEAASGKFCSITVVGHSDRDDTPGLTPEQRRESERSRSADRAHSAVAWLLDQVGARFQQAGLTIPLDWPSMDNVEPVLAYAGAAVLVHPNPANENERTENRRVEFFVVRFSE